MKPGLLLFVLLTGTPGFSQQDPEFPKGTVIYLGFEQGKSTSFTSSPDLWVGSLSFSPQFTVIPKRLRVGGIAELAYTDKHTSALFGPRIALKIKTIKLESMGSLLNLQLQAEYLWGTRDQRMIGGGLTAEIFQLFTLGLAAHRDHSLEQWWFRAGLGVRLFHKKNTSPTGEDPMGGR